MKLCKIIAPYVLILVVLSNVNWLLAKLSGERYIHFNKPLEDAKILSFRKAVKSGAIPQRHDFVLAGTSRTIAAFDPAVISEKLAQGSVFARKQVSGINLGNLCNSPLEFEYRWKEHGLDFDLLILEFSPHMMTRPSWKLPEVSQLSRYTLWTREVELLLTGWVKEITGSHDIFYAKPRYVYHVLKTWHESGLHAAELYYFSRCTINAYGGRFQPNGHADFWSYLPDQAAFNKLAKLYKSEADQTMKILSKVRLNPEEWQAYQRIILRALQLGKKVVLVRPPVQAELYAAENENLKLVLVELDAFLKIHPVPYYDMNPNHFQMMDKTHLDWYDATEVSTNLAEFINRHL